jgi:hypothetical protein
VQERNLTQYQGLGKITGGRFVSVVGQVISFLEAFVTIARGGGRGTLVQGRPW